MANFTGTDDAETHEFDSLSTDIVSMLGGNDRIRLLGYDSNNFPNQPPMAFQINGGAGVDRLVLVNNFQAFTYVNLNGASISSIEWVEVQAGVRAFFTSAQFAAGAISPTAGLYGVEAKLQITLTTANCDLSRLSVTGSVEITFLGSNDRNVLHGNDDSRDFFWGFAGNDALYGHGGRDPLDGGEGIDRLFGGKGNDVLIVGGDHRDTIVFKRGDGRDLVEGFNSPGPNAAILDIRALSDITSFADLKAHHVSRSVNGDKTIIQANGTTIVLENTQPGDLAKSDFLF